MNIIERHTLHEIGRCKVEIQIVSDEQSDWREFVGEGIADRVSFTRRRERPSPRHIELFYQGREWAWYERDHDNIRAVREYHSKRGASRSVAQQLGEAADLAAYEYVSAVFRNDIVPVGVRCVVTWCGAEIGVDSLWMVEWDHRRSTEGQLRESAELLDIAAALSAARAELSRIATGVRA